eukprot:jgi/Hompol1/5129/HPOL_004202-RA
MLPVSRAAAVHVQLDDGSVHGRSSSESFIAHQSHTGHSISPLSAGSPPPFASASASASASRRRVRRSSSVSGGFQSYFRRMFSFPQMDFDLALWQIAFLVISPKRNQWARDDPAFHLLIAIAMCVAAIAYGIAYGCTVVGTLRLILYTVFAEFLGAGLIISTTTWFITNQYMLQQQLHAVEQSVEWMYAFDVHCNAFVPFFLVTYVFQFFLLRIVLADGFIYRLIANSIYLVALVYYWYITFLGYNALPFVKNSIVFLYPIGVTVVVYLISLFTFNASKTIFELYFE